MSDERIAKFYRLTLGERISTLAEHGLLSAADADALQAARSLLPVRAADRMIENVIGVFGLPLAVVPDFRVNGRRRVVPMAVEEPSIVAGIGSVARLAWDNGGFRAAAGDPIMTGQLQLVDIEDPDAAIRALKAAERELLRLANELQPRLVARGGGVRGMDYERYAQGDGRWAVIVNLQVDTRDAMGANVVNSICEGLAPSVERYSGATACLRILSNLCDRALVRASVTLPAAALARSGIDGAEIRDRIVKACEFADADPHRAATHNKGIMNGIDAVAIATGNDWRAIEAGAHAYAARDGAYRSLTAWAVSRDGALEGTLEMPLKVGVVGGSQGANPGAALGLRIAAAGSAQELAELMAAVGLAQNLAALRALVADGIQKGHMSLHARGVASAAGASGELFDRVVAGMIESGEIKPWKAAELMESMRDPVRHEVPDDAAKGVAAGKVILLGEHAAVFGRRVLALPLAAGVVAHVAASRDGGHVTLRDRETGAPFAIEAHDGVSAVLSLIRRHFGVEDREFDIHIASRIPLAMGLGSSAALAVALIRAFDRHCGTGMSDAEVEGLAFECEKISHGTPSGIDNHVATHGRPVVFSRGDDPSATPVTLTEAPPLVIAASGTRGETRVQVAAVRARHDRQTALYESIFDEIDGITVAGAAALADGDYGQLADLMNVCHGLLNAIGVSTAELENMVSIAREHGALGAKLTGAGGGGSIVALCPDKVAEVAGALRAAGYRTIHLEDQ